MSHLASHIGLEGGTVAPRALELWNSIRLSRGLYDQWNNLCLRSEGGDELVSLLEGLRMSTADAVKIALVLRSFDARISISSGLANIFESGYQSLGSINMLEKAITCRLQALFFAAKAGTLTRSNLWYELGDSVFLRSKESGNSRDIEEAIRYQELALAIATQGNGASEEKRECLTSLAISWQSQFERLGNQEAMVKAAEYYEQALQLTKSPLGRLSLMHNVGNLWGHRYDQLGKLADLNKAIESQARTLQHTPAGHRDKPKHLWNLLSSYQRRFERLGDLADLGKAIDYCADAVQITSNSDQMKTQFLEGLGELWMRRYERLDNRKDLDSAIDCRANLVKLTPISHIHKPKYLHALGFAQERRYRQLGDLNDLEKAIESYMQTVRLAPITHPDRSKYLSTLGSSWLLRFERLGDLVDIEKAIKFHKEAVQLTSKGHPSRSVHLNDLGISLNRRFVRVGDIADVDNAIKYLTEAVQLTPNASRSKSTYLHNLGSSFIHRFERLGDLGDLQKGIDYSESAVNLTPENHIYKAMHLSDLANAWLYQFQSRHDQIYLEKAIDNHRKAVQSTPQYHSDRPMRLSNLANSLTTRFQLLRNLGDAEHAVKYLEEAIELTPDGHPVQPGNMNNIGNVLRIRLEELGDPKDIDRAISSYSKAVQLTPEGHPDKPMYLMNLGISHQLRSQLLNRSSDLESAIESFKRGAQAPVGNTSHRLWCARQWAKCSVELGVSPLQAYRRSFALLPQLVWLGLGIQGRYNVLEKVGNLAAEAASWAISVQCYDMALEWLEEGRSIVWSQILQLRTPVDDLNLVNPEIANSLKEIASQLDGTRSTSLATNPATKSLPDIEEQARRNHDLANRWEENLTKARQLPGFQNFMLPRTSEELKKAAVRGPVVVVNIDGACWDALIVLPQGRDVIHVPLTHLLLEQQVGAYKFVVSLLGERGAWDQGRGIKIDRPKQTGASENQIELLRFAWKTIVGPVFNRLGYTQKSTYGNLPHITWCVTGAYSFLPLHAAGPYDGSSSNAFDLVVSSYTPTLGALIAKNTPSMTRQQAGILAIGQANTRGFSPLPKTVEELAIIKKYAKAIDLQLLDGASATINATLSAMERHNWVHLACHASQNESNSIHSAFHLYDGELTLEQIAKRAFTNKGLAFLSACQTASGDGKLPDEATHLAAGMLIAGYPSVIATMWSIMDDDAPEIVEKVYADLIQGDQMDHTRAAVALHRAVGKLREKVGIHAIERWAPFIHIGL